MAFISDVNHTRVQSENAHQPSRRKQKSRDDPFLQLPITPSPLTSPARTPGEKDEDPLNYEDKHDRHESILIKIILTPILMTSFVLSLFLVNNRDRSARAGATNSILSYLSPYSWLSAEPYQDPQNTTWGISPTSDTQQPHMHRGDTNMKDGKWFIRKKHRKMAKLQISDALDMGSTVMMGLCVVLVLSIGLMVWGAKWLHGVYLH